MNYKKQELIDKGLPKFAMDNLLTPLLTIVIFVIIYSAIKYINDLYGKYPRSFRTTKFLDMSSKYDKSTGLDNELADTLS